MLGSGVQILNSKSKEVDEVEYVEMETPLLQISNSCVFPDFLRRTQDTSPSADSRLQTPDSRLQTPDSRLQTPDSRLQTRFNFYGGTYLYQTIASISELRIICHTA